MWINIFLMQRRMSLSHQAKQSSTLYDPGLLRRCAPRNETVITKWDFPSQSNRQDGMLLMDDPPVSLYNPHNLL
jgi:hypothetical protein